MTFPKYILLKNLLSIAKEHHDATNEDAAIMIEVEFRPKWIWKTFAKVLGMEYRVMTYVGKIEGSSFKQKASFSNE